MDKRAYEQHKGRTARRQSTLSAAGREIGRLPPIVDPVRRRRAVAHFRAFCDYFPNLYTLPFSPDHLLVIGKIENAVMRGGLFAVAMPRGSGKTTLAETACLWAILIGAAPFVALIGSGEGHAEEMLESIKMELATNPLLLDDFPEVCYPIAALDGISQRAGGQLYHGRRTHIGWTAKRIVLPTIAGSQASGATIHVAGITGRIRGMKHKRPDGSTVRPSLVIIDDPQTDESAASASQCATREAVLAGAVLGLAGPGQKIAGILPCTVIRPGDMADNILDREKYPEWQGERTKMVYAWPKHQDLWDQYATLRQDSLRADGDGSEATRFYADRRDAMDEGARVAWPERYNRDELSAIQHAVNLKIRDEAAFFAEYQNDPIEEGRNDELLSAAAIAKKQSGHRRGEVPAGCAHLSMFVDVHDALLYFVVAAWCENFTGYAIDYGTWPDQRKAHFTMRQATATLRRRYAKTGREGAIRSGLEDLTAHYVGREYQRDDGTILQIGRCLIDTGYLPDVVEQFIRASGRGAVIVPSLGIPIRAANKPFGEYKHKRGDRSGHHWRIPATTGTRLLRTVQIDTNYWKSFAHARFAVAAGDTGCLSLFTDPSHRMFSEQMHAEFFTRTEGRGRTVDEWQQRPNRPDNHFFDALVGCAVGASMLGARLPGIQAPAKSRPKRKRKRVTYH